MKDFLVKQMQSVCRKKTLIPISFAVQLKISLLEDKKESIEPQLDPCICLIHLIGKVSI